jgi:hypothetical protein
MDIGNIMLESTIKSLCRSTSDKDEIKRRTIMMHPDVTDNQFETLYKEITKTSNRSNLTITSLSSSQEESKIKFYMEANIPLYVIRILIKDLYGMNKKDFDQILANWERKYDSVYETYKIRQVIYNEAMDKAIQLTLPKHLQNNHVPEKNYYAEPVNLNTLMTYNRLVGEFVKFDRIEAFPTPRYLLLTTGKYDNNFKDRFFLAPYQVEQLKSWYNFDMPTTVSGTVLKVQVTQDEHDIPCIYLTIDLFTPNK